MRRIVSILLLQILWLQAFGQSSLKDSLDQLKNEIRQATYYDSTTVFMKGIRAIRMARELKDVSQESTIYQYYGNFCYFSGNVEQANQYYNKSIKLAEQAHNKQLVNSTRIRKTFIEMDTDIVAAETHFHDLLNEANKGHFTENQIEIYNGLGILHENKLMFDRSLYFYQQGLRLAEKHHKNYMICFLLNNIGLLKCENKRMEEARQDLERGFLLTKKLNEPRLALNLLNNLGLVYQQLNEPSEAIKHYQLTVVEARKIGFPNLIVAAYINLSSNYLVANQVKDARNALDSARVFLHIVTDPGYQSAGYIIQTKIELEENKFTQATQTMKILGNLLKRFPSPNDELELLRLKTDLAEKRGDYKKAFQIQQEVLALADSITTISNQNELSKLQTIYGKERMESELDEIKNKNKLLLTENELKTANFRLFGSLIAFLAIVIAAFIYIQYIRKTRAVRVHFSKSLLHQIDEERSRISKDLHDDIGQSLSVIKSKINLLNKGMISSLDGMEGEVGEIIEQTRKLSHELHPSGIEKIGLMNSINNLLNKIQNGTGIITSMDWELEDQTFSLLEQAQIYRIFQECVNNTIKHAHASALKISGIREKDEFILTYVDNGTGIKEPEHKKGIGMMTIKERVDVLKGKMEIRNKQPGGLMINIYIPAP